MFCKFAASGYGLALIIIASVKEERIVHSVAIDIGI